MKYLVTPTLLNSWKYCVDNEYGSLENFMKTLNKEEVEDQSKFIKGNEYEAYMVAHYPDTLHGCYQVKVYEEITINGIKYLVYGKIDCLKAGVITDYKHTSVYEVGKFYGSYQTAIYMGLVKEACKMQYVICNNFDKDKMTNDWEQDKDQLHLFKEEYSRDELKIDLREEINSFMNWLEKYNLLDTYHKKWASKY